jgi:membrane-anchored mycosin MYCP
MTEPAQVDPARFRTDQIVVATPHRKLVLEELQSFRNNLQSVKIDEDKSDPLLGLSIIDVEHDYHETDDARSATLEALMAAVRSSCQKKYAGWVPTMGKNRLLDRIDGGGEQPAAVVGGAEPPEGARAVNLARHGVGETRWAIGGGGGGLPKRAEKGDIGRFEQLREDNKGLGRGIKVALLDTKIADIGQGWEIEEAALLSNGGEPIPYPAGHATFVAGLIHQQAPSVDLKVFSVLNNQGLGDAWDLARKMVHLARSGERMVLNLSLGCSTDDNSPPLLLRRAVELLAPNTVIVAAAGNHGGDNSEYDVKPNAPFWPAALPYVIGVGAETKPDSNERASFSPDAKWVRLLGPGDQVTSTFPENVQVSGDKDTIETYTETYAKWSGTSFAAATITGRIAALMAALTAEGKLRELGRPSPPKLACLSGEKLKALLKLSRPELASLSDEELKDLLELSSA